MTTAKLNPLRGGMASYTTGDEVARTLGNKPNRISVGWLPFGSSPIEYRVLRNDRQIGKPVSLAAMTYADKALGLLAGATATYKVVALNADLTYAVSAGVVGTVSPDTPILTKTTFEECAPIATASITGWQKIIDNGHSISVTTERFRTGTQSCKFDFLFADWTADVGASDDFSKSDHCMISQNVAADLNSALPNTEMWVGISNYLDFWPIDNSSNGEILFQFHGSNTGHARHGSPPVALYCHGSSVQIFLSADPTGLYGAGQPRTAPIAVGMGPVYQVSDLLGKWNDWVIRVIFDLTNGLLQVWKDGVLIVDYTGSTTYSVVGETDNVGPFFNFGVYKWDWGNLPTVVNQRTVFVDEVRIGDGTATYADVAPGQ